MNTHMYTYRHTDIQTYMYTNIIKHTHAHIYLYNYLYVYYIYIYIYIYIYVCFIYK